MTCGAGHSGHLSPILAAREQQSHRAATRT